MPSPQTLPGFRDFYPEDFARQGYLFETWRRVANRYNFSEAEAPMLEPLDIYLKKSGDEIAEQLFHFTDKGNRAVALRPEMTPSLIRMAAARERHYPKPIKWFSIGRFFRYEKAQRGRLREFYQFNCDILGDNSIEADAELLHLLVDTMLELGFTADEFRIRINSRAVWQPFLQEKNLAPEKHEAFYQIIDKINRLSAEKTNSELANLGINSEEVIEQIEKLRTGDSDLRPLLEALTERGIIEYIENDPTIVRGLAYYTGTVFEVFDTRKKMRAIAGGGRYDHLAAELTEGKTALTAIGFAFGDVVLLDMIEQTPSANDLMLSHIKKATNLDCYIIPVDNTHSAAAHRVANTMRNNNLRVESGHANIKTNKNFKQANRLAARTVCIIGEEYPQITVKNMQTSEETVCEVDKAVELINNLVD